MANQVFANNREVSCRAGSGKSICAMPDVCLTPPENPATPPGVPVPYPNSAFDSDTSDGSKSVQISGKEVMLKNASFFKSSTGDEAGCAAKKGMLSSTNKGKVYFTSWSMDVMFEGQNAVRHLDMTTNNHASPASNEAVPWPFVASMSSSRMKALCKDMIKQEKEACREYTPHTKGGKDVCEEAGLSGDFTRNKSLTTKRTKSAHDNPCAAARRCRLVAFNAKPDGTNGCCPAQTADHIVPKASFFTTSVRAGGRVAGWKNYSIGDAPCMCTEGGSCTGSHGLRHAYHKAFSSVPNGTYQSFDAEIDHCAKSAKAVAPQCDERCIAAQLKEGHKSMGDVSKPIRHRSTGRNFADDPGQLRKLIRETLPARPAAG